MRNVDVLFVPLLTFLTHAQRTYVPFNCQRENSPCVVNQGGQCQADGTCSCTNNLYGGYNCALQISSILSAAACTTTCENNGVCYGQGGGARCYCTEAYYGVNCQSRRVAITGCTGDSMTVVVNPHQTGVFNGRIYVLGLINNQQCNINVAATAPLAGFTKTLSLSTVAANNPCAIGLKVSSNDRAKSYSVVVQYDAAMITPTDELHTFQCSQTSNGQFTGFVLGGVDFNTVSDDKLTGTDINVGHVPLSMTITTQPNRGSISQSIVKVGDDLFIEISLTSTTTFTAIKIDELQASDSINNPTQTKVLLQNGCPVARTNGIGVGAPTKPDQRTLLIPFKMFKYITSDSVYFSARTTLCTANEVANCNPSICSGQPNGLGRRRRESGAPVRGETTTRLFVITPGDNTVKVESCENEHSERFERCIENPAFVVVVSLVSVLLLIAVVTMLILCGRVHRNRRKKTRDTPFPPPTVTRM